MRMDDPRKYDLQGSIPADGSHPQRLLCAIRSTFADDPRKLHHRARLRGVVGSSGFRSRPRHLESGRLDEEEP